MCERGRGYDRKKECERVYLGERKLMCEGGSGSMRGSMSTRKECVIEGIMRVRESERDCI